ncbi:hypothetical protein R3P38DRAFT_3194856 [Favolaschia claudopus]|uniref:Uncharacterized protein n=1 Tax=Favolaschia claudopus TaxID=2862362 RepID=A0AAW0BE69_9AGAR
MRLSDTPAWAGAPWKSKALRHGDWLQVSPQVTIDGLDPQKLAHYWDQCRCLDHEFLSRYHNLTYQNIARELGIVDVTLPGDSVACPEAIAALRDVWTPFQLLDLLFSRMERDRGQGVPDIPKRVFSGTMGIRTLQPPSPTLNTIENHILDVLFSLAFEKTRPEAAVRQNPWRKYRRSSHRFDRGQTLKERDLFSHRIMVDSSPFLTSQLLPPVSWDDMESKLIVLSRDSSPIGNSSAPAAFESSSGITPRTVSDDDLREDSDASTSVGPHSPADDHADRLSSPASGDPAPTENTSLSPPPWRSPTEDPLTHDTPPPLATLNPDPAPTENTSLSPPPVGPHSPADDNADQLSSPASGGLPTEDPLTHDTPPPLATLNPDPAPTENTSSQPTSSSGGLPTEDSLTHDTPPPLATLNPDPAPTEKHQSQPTSYQLSSPASGDPAPTENTSLSPPPVGPHSPADDHADQLFFSSQRRVSSTEDSLTDDTPPPLATINPDPAPTENTSLSPPPVASGGLPTEDSLTHDTPPPLATLNPDPAENTSLSPPPYCAVVRRPSPPVVLGDSRVDTALERVTLGATTNNLEFGGAGSSPVGSPLSVNPMSKDADICMEDDDTSILSSISACLDAGHPIPITS